MNPNKNCKISSKVEQTLIVRDGYTPEPLWDGTALYFKVGDNFTEPVELGGGGGSTDAATLNGEDPAYYLDRGNHTGTQAIETIDGLGDELGAKADLVDGVVSESQLPDIPVDWDDVEDKPTEFPPSAHTHPISEVIGLNNTLLSFNNSLLEKADTSYVVNQLANKSDVGHTHRMNEITGLQNALNGKLDVSEKGSNNGVAELDSNGKVPSSRLPSYVDDVEEYDAVGDFPIIGESGKIYITKDTNLAYRWSGTVYVEISPSIALGETSSTAYRGDRGATAYSHSQSAGNPHNTQIADIPNLEDALDDKVNVVDGKQLSDENYTTAEKNKLSALTGEWFGTRADYLLIVDPDPNIKYFLEKE